MLVIVDDLNIVGMTLAPHKTDTVLIVDSDAVLTSTVPSKRLQHIARRYRQIIQDCCRI